MAMRTAGGRWIALCRWQWLCLIAALCLCTESRAQAQLFGACLAQADDSLQLCAPEQESPGQFVQAAQAVSSGAAASARLEAFALPGWLGGQARLQADVQAGGSEATVVAGVQAQWRDRVTVQAATPGASGGARFRQLVQVTLSELTPLVDQALGDSVLHSGIGVIAQWWIEDAQYPNSYPIGLTTLCLGHGYTLDNAQCQLASGTGTWLASSMDVELQVGAEYTLVMSLALAGEVLLGPAAGATPMSLEARLASMNSAHFYLSPLDAGTGLLSASGHDYAAPAVPEPGTLALLLAGLCLVLARPLGRSSARRLNALISHRPAPAGDHA